MAPKSQPSVLLSYHYLPWKPPSSADLSTTEKIKTLVQDHILAHVGNAVRALNKAKSMVMGLVSWKGEEHSNFTFAKMKTPVILMKRSKKKKRRSFRMCSNWHSSHVLPMPEQTCTEEIQANRAARHSSWSAVVSNNGDGCGDQPEPQLSGYLHWLEEKMPEDGMALNYVDEIDRLAEMFIAKCHEKFRLEKQESLRMYQEMLARSM